MVVDLIKFGAEWSKHFPDIKPPVDNFLSFMFKDIVIDIFRLENDLIKKGYDPDKESMAEFIEKEYGKEARKFIECYLDCRGFDD